MADFNHLLTSVDFSGTLTTKTVDLTVRLSFVNRDRVSHEMVYFFRSTPQLDVYDFKIYRPNDHREASLLPRLEAGRRYAQALEEGRPAAKLTSYPYHVWELCHSRLEPGCEIIVEIKLFGAMMHHSGRSVLQLPLTIVPFNMPSEVRPNSAAKSVTIVRCVLKCPMPTTCRSSRRPMRCGLPARGTKRSSN